MQRVTRITLSKAEFERFRPLNGHVLVLGNQDVETMKGKHVRLFVDNTYKPERHQKVHNVVVKVPDKPYNQEKFKSSIDVMEGEKVIINYFPVMQSIIIDVEDVIYRLVPYNWLIMSVDSGKMLNDWIMVDKIIEKPESTIEMSGKESRKYFHVVKGFSGTFLYLDKKGIPLEPKPGDKVVLRDSAVLPLEDELHLEYDGSKHYVTRAYKVLSILN